MDHSKVASFEIYWVAITVVPATPVPVAGNGVVNTISIPASVAFKDSIVVLAVLAPLSV
jgi:hypothetical protein